MEKCKKVEQMLKEAGIDDFFIIIDDEGVLKTGHGTSEKITFNSKVIKSIKNAVHNVLNKKFNYKKAVE